MHGLARHPEHRLALTQSPWTAGTRGRTLSQRDPLCSRHACNSQPILAVTSLRSRRMSSRAARRRFRHGLVPYMFPRPRAAISPATSMAGRYQQTEHLAPNRWFGSNLWPSIRHAGPRLKNSSSRLRLLIIYSSSCKQRIDVRRLPRGQRRKAAARPGQASGRAAFQTATTEWHEPLTIATDHEPMAAADQEGEGKWCSKQSRWWR